MRADSCCQTHLEAEEEEAEDWKGLMQHALLQRQVKSRGFKQSLERRGEQEPVHHFAVGKRNKWTSVSDEKGAEVENWS